METKKTDDINWNNINLGDDPGGGGYTDSPIWLIKKVFYFLQMDRISAKL